MPKVNANWPQYSLRESKVVYSKGTMPLLILVSIVDIISLPFNKLFVCFEFVLRDIHHMHVIIGGGGGYWEK